MGYPVAAGVTTMSGGYIPEVWSGKLLIKFYTATVFGSITNTEYEGDIKAYGDTVHILTVPDVAINDYVIGQDLSNQRPTPSKVDLLINKGKYYSMAINDVERKQAKPNYVERWTDDAGQQMKISIDSDILGDVYADADTYNKGNSAGKKSGSIQLGATGAFLSVDK